MLGAIVLAGGPSSRLGKNKALIELNGKPLLRHVVDQCISIDAKVVVVIGREDTLEVYTRILPQNVELARDISGHKNPVNGIASGVGHLNTAYTLVLPCDTPFVRSNVLKFLFEKAQGYDAVVPLWPNGHIEPLHAIYKLEPTRCALQGVFGDENPRVSNLIERLERVRYIDTEEIKELDPLLASFMNINSLHELKLAEEILRYSEASIAI
jgi:molybdopterin-guanine dinucleotide biosynthesis protein A